ncbi:hypothetical protein [Flavobacterium sp.]|uniref:hypothetical protein n=1 Tax=Flavobacterium sp. TaxID=239 RepID=UPI003340BFFD
MKKLELNQIENINGGINKAEFCAGFGLVALGYEAGVVANFWNPIGWGGAASLVLVGIYCAV